MENMDIVCSIDDVIKYCTAKIVSNDNPSHAIGSGVLLRQDEIGDKLYMLTAVHCLNDISGKQLESIKAEIYNPLSSQYESITIQDLSDRSVLLQEGEQEIALVILKAHEVLAISPNLPSISIVLEPAHCARYVCAGFPKASGHTFEQTNANWIRQDTLSHTTSLRLENDYISCYVEGFSGGGIFCITHNEVILVGIMSEYRIEERGKYIIGSDLSHINENLYASHLPQLHLSYVIAEGITEQSIQDSLNITYRNLGKRFMPTFNVDTTVQDKLDTLCRTLRYNERLIDITNRRFNAVYYLHNAKDDIYNRVVNLQKLVIQKIQDTVSSPISKVDFSECKNLAQDIINTLYEKEAEKDKNTSKDDAHAEKWDNLIRLRQHCYEILSIEEVLDASVANSNILIVHGEAGCGKSHLLGYFSQITNNRHCPVLLMMGSTFSSSHTIEENIISQLNASCTFDDLLAGLNLAGKRYGQKIPILIDALNETQQGQNYWRDRLPGFVEHLSRYAYVALIVSIRDTYFNRVLSEEVRIKWKNVMCLHEGFKDDEYNAIRRFCEYYQLAELNMPVLNPEFCNPLYLHMACRIAKDSGQNNIPMGWDKNDLFDAYAKKLDKDFDNIREGLYTNRHVVSQAVKVVASKMFSIKREYIPLAECDALLSDSIRNSSYLLTDLLDSSLLSLECDNSGREYVRFTYQRMCDYCIARVLLSECNTKEDVTNQLRKHSDTLISWRFNGVLEQLFIMVPEMYDVELWEVMDENLLAENMKMLLDSFRWRSAKHIHEDEIIRFIREHGCSIEDWWSTLLVLAPIPNHPFNGERWNAIMKRQNSMADRDAVLQEFILETIRWKKDNTIARMLHWAWTPGISGNAQSDVVWLVAITLVWMLSSTIHQLRDQVTKAMVNLLQYQPRVLLNLLNEFSDVDDMYIQERLMAVAYGCVLRCNQPDMIREIGQYVYHTMFVKGNLPKHLLIRDYACGIVEFAYRKCALKNVDMQLVLPPYNAPMPALPKREDVEKYRIDYNDKSEKYAWQQNAILNSLYDSISDFGTKILSPSIEQFTGHSFTIEMELNQFIKQYKGKTKEWLKANVKARTMQMDIARKKATYPMARIDEKYVQIVEDFVQVCDKFLRGHISKEELDKLNDIYIPNHANKDVSRYNHIWDTNPYRYWIVQRVFELGYNREEHGPYDKEIQNVDESYSPYRFAEGRKERIGKKYEWIAYWELMGCLADNYYLEERWDNHRKKIYEGAWQHYWRDCDPTCITRRYENEKLAAWQDFSTRSDWNLPTQKWLSAPWTLDEVRQMIERKDATGTQWWTLHDYETIHAPQELGEDQYHYSRFYHYGISAYIVRKSGKKKLLEMAKTINFNDYELEDADKSNAYYITREKYWSRACDEDKSLISRKWNPLFEGSGVNVIVPYVTMNGNIEGDDSGTRVTYYMPIQSVFEDMNLQYADVDGDFIQNGTLCGTCNPNRTIHFLMQRNALEQYLNSKNLEIVWVITNMRYVSADRRSFMNSEVWKHSCLVYVDAKGELQIVYNVKKQLGA